MQVLPLPRANWKPQTPANVAVALSGGVDSSVSAYLLKEQGFNVTGVFMQNWDPQEEGQDGAHCSALQDIDDAKKVCQHLEIPFKMVNFVPEYWNSVFEKLLKGYKQGLTPNPDIYCNREIKFHLFASTVLLNFDYFATGHYVINSILPDNSHGLFPGSDLTKDQSYWLCQIDPLILDKVIFPLGSIDKSLTRKLALKAGLITHDKRDSTGICMIGPRDFGSFLSSYLVPNPGIVKCFVTGSVLDEIEDINPYTIGQNAGIGGLDQRYYVYKKDMTQHTVFVVPESHEHLLFSDKFIVGDFFWLEKPNFDESCNFLFKGRSNMPFAECFVHPKVFDTPKSSLETPESLKTPRIDHCIYEISTPIPHRALAPGQFCVLYNISTFQVLGGGTFF